MNGPGWFLDREGGLAVMRFGLLAEHGVRHGLVVRDGGRAIDEEAVYRSLASEKLTVVTEQTHSTKAADVGPGFADFFPSRLGADGLMTGEPGVTLTIHTADCVPVFLALPGGTAVGLFHCGWRGTAGGFLTKAAGEMAARYRADRAGLLAVIGPCIEKDCYPVGPEAAESFPPEVKSERPDGRWLVDLKAENRRQLLAAGLKGTNVHVSPLCTRCRDELFHSYRREGAELEGKMVAYIEAGHEEERS
ncbi:MAG TPA: hypothetical protein DDW31_06075 [candidate division Zixibacteria bacterium]|nr:hypothetical protein [candidate division Zixibacteria bacterium]